MKQISKNSEPNSLTEHRRKSHSNYDNYPDKDELRKSLYNEQRGICCYCMSVIYPDRNHMKIEHYKCQEDNPSLQLTYSNLLGSCKGAEGSINDLQHCDTYKGKSVLNFAPQKRKPNIEATIYYG